MIKKFIIKDIENYGLLKISPDGRNYLKTPYEIMLMRDHEYEEGDDDDIPKGQVGDNAADPVIFAMLKELRKEIALKLKLPPFIIFQDPSLEEMAIQYPITMDEMKNIVGVGEGKAKKFGQPFIDLIDKYVKENEIERPQDLIVKSVVNKSSLKVFIIQNIDRKIPLEDICNAKGIDFEELLNELEAIVYSGTKINLNYAINQVIEEEKQEEIFDYFNNADSDNLTVAYKELGEDDYTLEEIRLVRLKFISEIGN